ncbi:MAG TPA: hypothetical protein VE258_00300 [Ktedonobacterales bacterium]|nr:hypothetical protein [Ktedonobacterales bacterium]
MVGDTKQPRAHGGAAGIAGRRAPDGDERLLEHVFRQLAALGDANQVAKERRAKAQKQRGERLTFASANAANQLALGLIRCLHHPVDPVA